MSHYVWNMEHKCQLQSPRPNSVYPSLILLIMPLRIGVRSALPFLFRLPNLFGFKFLARLIIFDLSQSQSGI
jgi:hypothetical protein